ncbi:MAG: endonuclease [candidate division WOR-3 bacterium]|jgi:endonuclease-3 related protein
MDLWDIYKTLLNYFGKQNWWPGDSKLEICIGAILVQNTNWKNVEKAIENFKKLNLLPTDEKNYLKFAQKIYNLRNEKLKEIIKPCGFYNSKVKTIKNFLKFLIENKGFEELNKLSDKELRNKLISIKGIGNETADAIMLYVFNRASFVISNYTIRILKRHGIELKNYVEYKNFIEIKIPKDIEVYKEFHALLVEVGKNFCKKLNPICEKCPINFYL